MPLHLTIRAGEKIFINGAVMQNAKSRTIDFIIENHARILRESELVLPKDADTLSGKICMALQVFHLSEDRKPAAEELHELSMALIDKLPNAAPVLKMIGVELANGNTYAALKAGRDLMRLEARSTVASGRR